MGKWMHVLSEVNEDSGVATCANCGTVKITKKDGRWMCVVARRQRRTGYLRGRLSHGLNPRQAEEYIADRGGLCEICGRGEQVVYVDHDHRSGSLRGALCRNCNLGIAYFGDDPRVLEAAIRYLDTTKTPHP